MSIKSKIKYWYLGGPLPTREIISETSVISRMPNTFEPSTSARFAQWCVKNILKIIALIIAITVPIYIHLDSKSASNTEQVKNNPVNDTVIHNDKPKKK